MLAFPAASGAIRATRSVQVIGAAAGDAGGADGGVVGGAETRWAGAGASTSAPGGSSATRVERGFVPMRSFMSAKKTPPSVRRRVPSEVSMPPLASIWRASSTIAQTAAEPQRVNRRRV